MYKRINIAVIPVAIMLLSACAVGPHYATPATPQITPANPHFVEFDQQQRQPKPWWTFFDDQQLTQLIASALAHNYDIRQAWSNFQASRAVFDQQQWEQVGS